MDVYGGLRSRIDRRKCWFRGVRRIRGDGELREVGFVIIKQLRDGWAGENGNHFDSVAEGHAGVLRF